MVRGCRESPWLLLAGRGATFFASSPPGRGPPGASATPYTSGQQTTARGGEGGAGADPRRRAIRADKTASLPMIDLAGHPQRATRVEAARRGAGRLDANHATAHRSNPTPSRTSMTPTAPICEIKRRSTAGLRTAPGGWRSQARQGIRHGAAVIGSTLLYSPRSGSSGISPSSPRSHCGRAGRERMR